MCVCHTRAETCSDRKGMIAPEVLSGCEASNMGAQKQTLSPILWKSSKRSQLSLQPHASSFRF